MKFIKNLLNLNKNNQEIEQKEIEIKIRQKLDESRGKVKFSCWLDKEDHQIIKYKSFDWNISQGLLISRAVKYYISSLKLQKQMEDKEKKIINSEI